MWCVGRRHTVAAMPIDVVIAGAGRRGVLAALDLVDPMTRPEGAAP
jgi:hypothetical protein